MEKYLPAQFNLKLQKKVNSFNIQTAKISPSTSALISQQLSK